MKELTAYDDVLLKQLGKKVVAEETHYVGIDGVWYEIDLTSGNAVSMIDTIKDFTDCGRKINELPKGVKPDRALTSREPRGKSTGTGAVSGQAWYESRRYWDEFRAWCDAQQPPRTYKVSTGFNPKKKDLEDFERERAGSVGEGAQGSQGAGESPAA